MDIAEMVAERSTCDRLEVGAVLVKNREIKATSYNGAPRGMPDCYEAGHMMENGHCVRTVHAEQNAILFSDRNEREGATMYVTALPCFVCTKLIANSGISEVVYRDVYPHKEAEQKILHYFAQAGIEARRFEPGNEKQEDE
jgi:dCMP deaminase